MINVIKKATALAVATASLFTVAFANDIMLISEAPEAQVDVMREPTYLTKTGTVTEIITDEFKSVTIDVEGEEYTLNVDDATVIINADGMPLALSEIKTGDVITGVHDMAMTMSIPPQSYAFVLTVVSEEKAAPAYVEVSKKEETEDGIKLYDKADNYIITIVDETVVEPYKTRNIVTADDITEGSRVLAFFDMMTLSIPAQAVANKVIILPAEIVVEETEELPEIADIDVIEKEYTYFTKVGEVKEILENQVVIDFEDSEFALNIGNSTKIVNADGMPINFADIKVGDTITATHNAATTRSLPPQSFARVIVVNEESKAAPLYVEVSKKEETEDGVKVYDKDDNYIITLTNETVVEPYKTRNIVTASDISEGSEILVYTDIMTLSLPAQAAASRVIIFPAKVESTIEEIDGVGMVALRALAEELGYNVWWNDDMSIELKKFETTIKLAIGHDELTIDGEVFALSNAPVLNVDKTFVPVEVFEKITAKDYDLTVAANKLEVR